MIPIPNQTSHYSGFGIGIRDGGRGELRSISEARRNHASAAADKSKLHGCSFDLEME
jgi:hypothetical protein